MDPLEQKINKQLPPQNLEAEESLLGGLMLDSQAIIKVGDFLSERDFYSPKHQRIYKAMIGLFESNSPIDILSVADALKEKKQLAEIGDEVIFLR